MNEMALIWPDLTGHTGIEIFDQPIPIGSDSHRKLFCRTLIETFDPYRPAVIDWPKLDDASRERLVSLPIWDIAVQTENRAGANVSAYAARIGEPLLRKSIELMGFEERRHRHVLAHMVTAYGITLQPEPAYAGPRDPEWAFLVTGYSECIDSFFAFGLFEVAKRSGFFPAELVDTFEPVIREESRHILFFVNWLAWHRQNLPLWRRGWFELKLLAVTAYVIWERIGIATGMSRKKAAQFTVIGGNQLGAPALRPADFIDICLAENHRRMKDYDQRLLRPTTMPAMVKFLRRWLRK
ncbi:MAG TPA: ferritin-like domain-containing protein [Micropepsaceae bacterium]|nr:ferritin-like domain-containing protein [Micropepsaceae bacterium]